MSKFTAGVALGLALAGVALVEAQPVQTTDVTFTGEGLPCDATCDFFGGDVLSGVDFNDDGVPDLAVTAFGAQRVYLFFGPLLADRDAADADVVIFGTDVNFAPLSRGPEHDLDGDGIADLIVGARNGGDDAGFGVLGGQVWIFYGPVTADAVVSKGVIGDADATIVGTDFFELGRSISVRDLDGDQIHDLAVGASQNDSGKLLIYPGPVVGTLTMADAETTIDGVVFFESFGDAATIGDFDGDGIQDLAVGAEGFPLVENSGRVYVFFGPIPSGSLSAANADLLIAGDQVNDQFGSHVANAGDVDGDGVEDLLVGADEVFGPGNGSAYLFLSPLAPGELTAAAADATFPGEADGGFERHAFVSGAGDVNGDGFDDILVGAPDSEALSGRVHLFFGPLAGTFEPSDADLIFVGPAGPPIDRLGTGLFPAGDLDGNGFDDFVMGAPGSEGAGFARIVYSPGLEIDARLQGSGTVPAGGGTISFEFELTNTTSASRTPDFWFTVERPGGGTLRRGPFAFALDPLDRTGRALRLRIRAGLPPGTYTVTTLAGRFPDAVASDGFTFEKLP